ncbi:family 1 glycosylhydrolase [Amycolatopsis coloradensis]|uniref:family 1 glycosylhydrolase n=1 Tax=Amycolatopsis coloradensis TaxID=76021 RepID=UPI001FC90222|nr:family 1 glycosylhydrolase [Amycolatopsis coloradensis]
MRDTYGQSHWAIDNDDTGEAACDHYHRMPADIALVKELGVDTYRFSVSWPRVQPRGRGGVNPAGIGFYYRLVDELLNNGIDPWLTLYRWDLPQHCDARVRAAERPRPLRPRRGRPRGRPVRGRLGTRFYLDALVRGRYPEDVLEDFARQGIRLPAEP